MKRLILFLSAASFASGAITERYVSPAGSGAADGTTEADAMSLTTFTDYMVTGGSFTAAAGDRFNLIAGTYARTTSTDSWVNGGSATSPVIVRGYTTTVTDGYQGRDSAGALVTTNMPDITYTTGVCSITGSFMIVESIDFSSTRNGSAFQTSTGTDSFFRWCRFSNAASGASGEVMNAQSRCVFYDCDFILSNGGNAGTNAITLSGTGGRIVYSRVTSTAIGVTINGTGIAAIGNTIYGCTGIGLRLLSTGGYATIMQNTIVGGGADGINVVTGTTIGHTILNNLITDNTGDAIDMVSTSNAAAIGNTRTRDNGSAIANGGDWTTVLNFNAVTTDGGGAETDYVNAGANNYNLLSTSPATSAGIPANSSIGALQRDQTTAGGSGEHSATFAQ